MSAQTSHAGTTHCDHVRRATITRLTVAVALIASGSRACGQDDFKPAVAWFDSLGYPDVSKVELVKVATGQLSYAWNKPPEKEYRPAFLLATEDESFKVLTFGLQTEWYTKVGASVGYEPADLKRAAAEYLQSLTKPQDSDEYERFLGIRISDTELFVLAYACAKRGLADEAKALSAHLKSELRSRRVEKAESLRQGVIDHLAYLPLFRFEQAFQDPKVTRAELLARFEKFIRDYPGPKPRTPWGMPETYVGHQATARWYSAILKKMVAEDRERARKPPKPESQMTREERIAELIYRLRDQHGRPADDYGAFDSGPAHELVKIGLPAVPQLIAALDDDRLTRIVWFSGVNNFASSEVVTVGFCAHLIIQKLAGRQFYDEDQREAIRAWWEDIEKKGEKQALVDAVAAAGPRLMGRPEMLVEKYPDAAGDALAKGIANAKDDEMRAFLVGVLGGVKGDGATALLRQQLKSPALRVRLETAKALTARGLDDGVAPMIEVWQRAAAADEELDALISYLARCGRLEAMKALGAGLHDRSGRVQVEVIEHVGNMDYERKDAVSFALASARDELLVQELANTERSHITSSWGDEPQVKYPRVCDLAAFYLAQFWKPKQPFRFYSPLLTRERYRTELINVWRERQGQPPLPLPGPRTVKRLPDSAIGPKLDAVLAAKNDAERKGAIQAIEELGLTALPAVREFLAGVPEQHPAHAALKKTAARLAAVVSAVEFTKASARPDERTQKLLDAYKGKPLNMAGLFQFARVFTKALPTGIAGLIVAIDREGDDSGVMLTFTLVKGDQPRSDFGTSHSVDIDGRFAYASGSGASYEQGVRPGLWDELTEHLQHGFDLGPEHQVAGGARIVLRTPKRDD